MIFQCLKGQQLIRWFILLLKKVSNDFPFNYYNLNELPKSSLKQKLNEVNSLSTSKLTFGFKMILSLSTIVFSSIMEKI